MTFDPTDFVEELPRRRRFGRRILPGALIDREVVSIANVLGKGAAYFALLYFGCRLLWRWL